MATYVLIHGAGSDGWHWHLVKPLLGKRRHDVVTMDLPVTDESAGLDAYVDTILDAIGDRESLIVVAQSLGGLVAPLVADRRPVEQLVFVNAMIPKPHEDDWWTGSGHPVRIGPDFDPVEVFLHDVPDEVIAAGENHVFQQSDRPMDEPWPLDAMPDVPIAAIVGRNDRFFPADWQRALIADRLGIEPIEVDSGHCPALACPAELVDALERLREEASG